MSQLVNGPIYHLIAAHGALNILNFALLENCYSLGKMLSIYLPSMEMTFNEILKVSNCLTCSGTIDRDDHELYFSMSDLAERVE